MDWQTADVRPSHFVSDAEARAARGKAPATGAWRDGDPAGARQFANLGPLELESGKSLPHVRMAFETFGTLNAERSNAVLIFHALTGDSHVSNTPQLKSQSEGWWHEVVGPGRAIDTNRWFVVCPNVLGGCQGTTGPASMSPRGHEWAGSFPFVTIRDQVAAFHRLGESLQVERWAGVIGGSMGGMHALEWAISAPDSLERLAVLAAPAAVTADQIALNSVQIAAIRADPHFADGEYYDAALGEGPSRGLSLARRMAMLNYRTAQELNDRFARDWQSSVSPMGKNGRYAVESYLDFHGNKFTRRFDANSYITLTEAMNSHDVTRERGTLAEVLGSIRASSLVIGIDSDRYFPLSDQAEIAKLLPRSIHGAEPVLVRSEFGHDAFLIESEPVGEALRALLES